MNSRQLVIGIFENEMYAKIAKKDLRAVGIHANFLKEGRGIKFNFLNRTEEIQLMVPEDRVEEAIKLLKTKFN